MKTMASVSMREASRENAVACLPQETLLEVCGVTLQYAAAQQLVTANVASAQPYRTILSAI